ncbi:MAG: response regulator transcription factor [Alphaproteobacteria bacterium]|nr:response regulator transcription factor [Alphaproteobacteria bacterium]
MRLLVVEDDKDLARQLRGALGDAGYAVDVAHDGEEGHFLGDTEPYDAVLLDLGLPTLDGITILQRWRLGGRNMPVLILTARDRWSDKVSGIDAGADDYLAKPFHMEEMLARIRALLRRAAGHASNEIQCGPLRLDIAAARVSLDGRAVSLTALEFRLLSYLMHHRDKVISRTELVEHLYEQDFDKDSNTIEVFIGRLRRKTRADLIQTVRGLGYRLMAPQDANDGAHDDP